MRNILKNIFCASLAGLILAGCSKEESDFAGTDNRIISFEMKWVRKLQGRHTG